MKNLRPIAALLGGALLLAGCGGSDSDKAGAASSGSSAAAEVTDVTLTLNWYPYGEHAPFYYGVKKGIFKKHGINLDIQAGQGSGKTVTAVGGDQTDFGWADTPAVMAGISQGVPIKSVGVFLQTTPAAVQFFKDENIKSPDDLKGKTIASTAGDALSATFPAFLKANGLTTNDVSMQSTDAAGKIAAVVSGRTDALLGFAHDQGPTIAEKAGKPVSYLRFADYGVEFLSNGLIASNTTIKDKPDLVREMVAATSESFAAAVKSPEDAVKAMDGASQQLPSEKVLLESWKETAKLLSTDATKGKAPGINDAKDWQQTIDVFTETGLLKGTFKPADFWDSSFAPQS
jgi:NitT/TauT family transport system substrate-binding protein